MADPVSKSLVSLGELTKPADTLVKKISNAVGVVFEPHRIRRAAKAEAEAAVMKANADIEITDLQRRAARRWIEEEGKSQQNMEDITMKALPALGEGAKPESVEDDWITNFFDKCRIISDAEMQKIWARVLAGEANKPGTFSKRTVNFLSDLDKTDAECFSRLCRFCWMLGTSMPLIFDLKAEIYLNNGVDFRALTHLEAIGLIRIDPVLGFMRSNVPKQIGLLYFGRRLVLEMPKEAGNQFDIGKVILTKTGTELAPICRAVAVSGFWEYVLEQWKAYSPKIVT